ncbi:chromosome segregation protein SMC [cyanobacterium endosymbiont of Epithemia clementina EcSB]|uniref:chromosome segregation protein SMC n=1 Tax=cyanobacterium endosymbiont of Epithemia clementina EcSB TaxID=3034674 RepID=UPI0024813787|nr:chromosome segregation protein SMC [cyanobacterium endosymbiont of Epithemia clementina EcSB]WGT67772.1 chromosome segregation protein SMC [cyanobacterium endosymbiont of Epithemia clementina EcSB]
MVHIKHIELSHFKSFGGTTSIPFMTGFTVVSGPNGSGKSNILDALLFCLGLATSKGMRAERLPDLVNHDHINNGKTQETSVSVIFDVSNFSDLQEFSRNSSFISQVAVANNNGNGDENTLLNECEQINSKRLLSSSEWTVTRRLRVKKGGNYSSNYYINGEPCNVSELHEQLNRLRIYPEGYNVVLQGDVTRIISMNSKERRQIIDELAGVAEFDRKIEKTKETLEEVREREERCRIIETELRRSLEKLAADRIKAEKYQKLKTKVHEKEQWMIVLFWYSLQQKVICLTSQISKGEQEVSQLKETLINLTQQIKKTSNELDQLNCQVKALGEDEQLNVASKLATKKAQKIQLQQRQKELMTQVQEKQKSLEQTQIMLTQFEETFIQLTQDSLELETNTIPFLKQKRDRIYQTLEMGREQANAIAETSDAWIQEQMSISRKISVLQNTLNPQKSQQARLTERRHQLENLIVDESQQLQITEEELNNQQQELKTLSNQITTSIEQIQTIAQQLAATETAQSILQETQDRLIKEHREKQRQLDRLEASQQAQQEVQGTYAAQLVLTSDLPGVYGLVAQLGQVNPRYQLALEISAGARLGYVVVEDDTIAAAGINLLKQAKAGRATFLPMSKIRSSKVQNNPLLRQSSGFIDFAVNLVICKLEYSKIFSYVFGNTIVFETLKDARSHIGKQRIVTLEGELIETSGAMTGGSKPKQSNICFGTLLKKGSEEIKFITNRINNLDNLLSINKSKITDKVTKVKELSLTLTEAKHNEREQQLKCQQLDKEIKKLTDQKRKLNLQLGTHKEELKVIVSKLVILEAEITIFESKLNAKQQQLSELEKSQINSEWQKIQLLIKTQENQLNEREKDLRKGEEKIKDSQGKAQQIWEKINEKKKLIEWDKSKKIAIANEQETLTKQLNEITDQIQKLESSLKQLNFKLGEIKKERDLYESTLYSLQNNQQQKTWKLEKLEMIQQDRKEALIRLKEQLKSQKAQLPEPLPEVPLLNKIKLDSTDFIPHIEQIQNEISSEKKRLEGMEPVNMLALEEYEKTHSRLTELTEKLSIIEIERTELLLRIENFTTLRYRSFKEAFDAINENFKTIFATLSDGDGYLQLDNEDKPFEGGLNLVAHPKGKPVQRLSSMSGGEKSLTALSFIFSLQKYRPSPFYAFDEVDMFLDGANVERLSKMIKKQAQQAQFIVVSLRRPMIEASERTIGVTQARGAYTQVLGIKL